MQNLELIGEVYQVFTRVRITDTFEKQELVLKTNEIIKEKNKDQYYKIQFSNTDLLVDIVPGDKVKIKAVLRGVKYVSKIDGQDAFFTAIDGWALEVLQGENKQEIFLKEKAKTEELPELTSDDLPF